MESQFLVKVTSAWNYDCRMVSKRLEKRKLKTYTLGAPLGALSLFDLCVSLKAVKSSVNVNN